MNTALRIILLIWILGYLFAACAPILGGHLFVGAISLIGALFLFVPWLLGIGVLVALIRATNPPRR